MHSEKAESKNTRSRLAQALESLKSREKKWLQEYPVATVSKISEYRSESRTTFLLLKIVIVAWKPLRSKCRVSFSLSPDLLCFKIGLANFDSELLPLLATKKVV